ncbi:MAG: UDP-N-acetylmuramoyl-L-alanyl-D-glutamate--2,6-diaminopimelate ligase [Candidatus Binataceae bacterium]
MKLREVIGDIPEISALSYVNDVEISGLSYDSRQVKPGALFFSMARDAAANRAYIEDALNRGARAVVVREWDGAAARPAVPVIECARPRLLMARAAARFFHSPSRRLDLMGVTGTSGKTTTTYLLASIFEAAGRPCGIIGTIGIFSKGKKLYSGLTTPEAIDLESALARMEQDGLRAVAAEISSIGLDERRVEELNFRAGIFTNLGRDHLDYHSSMEDYFQAKLRLFTELLARSAHTEPWAVVRGDDPYGQRVLDAVRGRKFSFGLAPGFDVYPERFSAGLGGIRALVRVAGRRLELRSPMLGEINLLNILGASAVSVALGVETEAVAEGVWRCPGAPGRLEAVTGPPGVHVLVDYAHKPDALEAVLRTLRALEPKRLLCVFGCGGDRDRGKRPLMGAIAARLADLPILTSDNPRSEDPQKIIAEVEVGIVTNGLRRITADEAVASGGYIVEPDRKAAIASSLRIASPGDLVLIAGKGHEDYQLIGGRRLDFDDRAVVRELVAGMER